MSGEGVAAGAIPMSAPIDLARHEHLPPFGYVQALPCIIRGDHVDDGEPIDFVPATLAGASYPALARVLNLIREDNGGPSWPAQVDTTIAARWVPYLEEMEAAVATLSDRAPEGGCYLDTELYTFAGGDEDAMLALAARSPSLTRASHFLNDFFEAFSTYADAGFDPDETPQAAYDRQLAARGPQG